MATRTPRTLLSDFALPNLIYSGAKLTIYEVDASLTRTNTLAPLYAAPNGPALLTNPQTLDSRGANLAPIYIDRPVIAAVTQGTAVETTGVMGLASRWRGVWAPGSTYYAGERVRDPGGPGTWLVAASHQSTTFAAGVDAGLLEAEIDTASIVASAADGSFPPRPGRNGNLLGFSDDGTPVAVPPSGVQIANGSTGGTPTALTAALPGSMPEYFSGLMVGARIGVANGLNPTLEVLAPTGRGARAIFVPTPTGPARPIAGELRPGNWAIFTYDAVLNGGAGGWIMSATQRPIPDAFDSPGLLINPFFEISQQNAAAPVVLGASYTPTLDLWGGSEIAVNGAATVQQVADPFASSPGFRQLRHGARCTVTQAQTSLAAGELLLPHQQRIEGTATRPLAWGTGDARGIDVVAIASASVGGTYAVALANAAATRSYVSTVTLPANTPTVIMVRVPGDTTGSWPADAVASMVLTIGALSGTTRQAPNLNVWMAGDFRSHASAVNFSATAGATLTLGYAQIFPTGVLPFADAATITGPALQTLLGMRRGYDAELMRCRRFFPRGQEAGIGRFVGEFIPFAGTTLPDLCVWPNGQNLSRTTYAALFAAIGTTYGAGDGSTTFGVPDVRGRALFGRDDMGGAAALRVTTGVSGIAGTTLGAAGGSQALQSHTHGINDAGHAHIASADVQGWHAHTGVTDVQGLHGHSGTVLTGYGGGGQVEEGKGAPDWQTGAIDLAGAHAHNFSTSGAGEHAHNITVAGALTGITAAPTGAGAAQNMPPALMCNVVLFAGV